MFLCNLAGVLLIAVATQAFSAQATFYVSPTGSDNNAGTLAAPFATITKAQNAVRAINTAMTDDIVVYLRGGWYSLSSTLTFASVDGGTNGRNVIYQAYTNEYPVISGGKQITGWTLSDATKNIWKATAPAGIGNRQLYINCVRAVRAHKGRGFSGSASISSTGYTIGSSDANMASWKNQSDIEFIFNSQHGGTSGNPGWEEPRCLVQNISSTSVTMQQPGWAHVRTSTCCGFGVKGPPWDIENAYELLDQAGEWYFDRTAGIVYYIPRTGENLATARVIAPVLESVVLVKGTIDVPVINIQFIGITFAHGTFMRPSGPDGWPEMQANVMWYAPDRTPGNVAVDAGRSIRFERCMFKHLGGAGLDINNGAKNNRVVGCVFTDISANCIQIGNTSNPTRTDVRILDDSNQVLNCYIHDAPVEFRGGSGIMGGYVSNLLLSHNEICNNPHSCIEIGWGWSESVNCMKNNVFTYNRLHDYMLKLWDGGGIYTLSYQFNSTWHHNYAYNWYCHAWYLDQGSDYFDVHHNVAKDGRNPTGDGGWLMKNGGMPHDLVHDNFTDDNSQTDVNFIGANNVYVTNDQWPQAALDIMNSAGIESAYTDIKTMPCGCSVAAQLGARRFPCDLPQKDKSIEIRKGFSVAIPAATHTVNLSIVDGVGRTIFTKKDLSMVNVATAVKDVMAAIPTGKFFIKMISHDSKGNTIAETTSQFPIVR